MIKFGHRGTGGYAPGNTLLSVSKALEFELDYIEIDVALCRTGEVVVIHDTRVDRTTDGKGFVVDKTFEELRALTVNEDVKIPLLTEVLDLIDKKKKINIEVKGEGSAQPVVDIIEAYVNKKGWTYDEFLISSFNYHELHAVHVICPSIKLGVVVAGIPLDYAECAVKAQAYSIHLSKEFLSQPFIDDAHHRGLKVFVYTINDAEYYNKVKSMGVDGIFTDFPDRF